METSIDLSADAVRISDDFYPRALPPVLACLDRVFYFMAALGEPWWAEA